MGTLPAGKLPQEILDRLLKRFSCDDPRVVLGPQVGEDAAVIDMGDRLLVAKTDPITFAAEKIGHYLVHINANDIACMGATPKWLLVTCLLPVGKTDVRSLEALFEDLAEACDELGITVCGGHTEVTPGLDRVILAGQLLGEVSRDLLVDKSRIRPGDHILLTKGIAIEGTCVLATERGDLLKDKVDNSILDNSRSLLKEPGISVVKDAKVALASAGRDVHGMHDPTEGGLWQGVRELATRAGMGVRIMRDQIPVLPETRILCEFFKLNPMGLLASGALLLAVSPSCESKLIKDLADAEIQTARIGDILPENEGLKWVCGDKELPIPLLPGDELIKTF